MTALWDQFVATGQRDVAIIAAGLTSAEGAAAASRNCADLAFRLCCQALLLGAEDIGRLALACEKAIAGLGHGRVDGNETMSALSAALDVLDRAFSALANPDASGARTEGIPLTAELERLESIIPSDRPRVPPAAPATAWASSAAAAASAPVVTSASEQPAAIAAASTFLWVPMVDEDMLDLFFAEANERIEELSIKLLDIEQRPDDGELLRDIFRDLHTVKGSSAMVALAPMNSLAHAAEDLVGQLRDGSRRADSDIVDALLAALDGLRSILTFAQDRLPIAFDATPVIQRLRDPGSRPRAAPALPAAEPAAPEPAARAPRPERQTIRVDFDKLDRLMNLVGELVLGRDGLSSAIQALAAVSAELSADRNLTRRLATAKHALAASARAVADIDEARSMQKSLTILGEEIGRVERVLVDISQDLDYATGRLDSVSDDLRDQVMKLRMVPVGGVFRKHHRTVRDLANSLGKRAKLELHGEETELDKLLVEALDEPLMHLVRNAVDHGIEEPEIRIAAGKPAHGTIVVSATHRGNQMVIQIRDDGKGIDPAALRQRARERELLSSDELDNTDDRQILNVIFLPGFSTAERVSEVSGRGVGMDVVKRTIITRLKGAIDIESTIGKGSTFTLRLPLTLAIIQVLLARTGGEVFALPLDPVIRTFTCSTDDIHIIQDREFIPVGDRQVDLIRLSSVLELGGDPYVTSERIEVILVDIGNETYGLACEHLIGKKEIVIKSLGDLLEDVPCAAGGTLLGDRCAIILDLPAIIRRALRRDAPPPPRIRRGPSPDAATAVDDGSAHILLVEDSDVVRESLRRLLVDGGFRCTTANDGVEGLAAARSEQFDLVSTDVMMPRMDGYELTRILRATANYKDIPIVMVTSRGERIDRVRGFDAGVDEYITKPHDRQLLLRVVRKLLADHGKGGGR